MFELRRVEVAYGSVPVLWDVSLKVEEGEIVSLLGANGAGKTTTLKTAVGLLRPRAGSVYFQGERISGLPPHRVIERGIALVPEGRMPFPQMTVRENLELGASTSRGRKQAQSSLEWVYSLFPRLKERESQEAGTLSGGEQQMMVIGRALMSRPKLLMLDEPSLGLAPAVVLRLFDLVKELRKEGVTILLVEQNVYQALRVSDRAYVLENGANLLHGESAKLLEDEKIRSSYLGL
ncbi:MAG: ABC transporter ATP-binding protein [Chloroflexi bacterium]|nr:ABC transporter ATP-binding protein [Chloroflexota bacterium]